MLDHDREQHRSINERRSESRFRVLFTGKIVYIDNSVSADCTIRDISACGARVSIVRGPVLDEPFLIVVRAAVVHPSRVAWHTSPQAGLHFLDSIQLGEDVPFQLEGVQRIWSALRRDHEETQNAWGSVEQPRQPRR